MFIALDVKVTHWLTRSILIDDHRGVELGRVFEWRSKVDLESRGGRENVLKEVLED